MIAAPGTAIDALDAQADDRIMKSAIVTPPETASRNALAVIATVAASVANAANAANAVASLPLRRPSSPWTKRRWWSPRLPLRLPRSQRLLRLQSPNRALSARNVPSGLIAVRAKITARTAATLRPMTTAVTVATVTANAMTARRRLALAMTFRLSC